MTNRLALAFDFGMRSIGCAIGQTISGTATELPPIKAVNGAPQWGDMAALIAEWEPNVIIVGLPLNMDGSESEMCQSARRFGNRLHGRFNIAVEMADERLTTREAKHEAHYRGRRGSYKDNPVDSIAARMILEGWLARQS